MKKYFLTTVLLLASLLGFSQVSLLKNEEDTKVLSKKVTALFKEGKVSECILELKRYWPLVEEEFIRIETQTSTHLAVIQQRFGKPIRSVKIREEKILDIALRETYIIQYQYSAIRLFFTYYKNPEGWIVHAFKWDDSFTEEFK